MSVFYRKIRIEIRNEILIIMSIGVVISVNAGIVLAGSLMNFFVAVGS